MRAVVSLERLVPVFVSRLALRAARGLGVGVAQGGRLGRWRCGYVGNSGRDTVWNNCQTISHGLLASNPSSRAHFVARDKGGATYRLVAEWRPLPDTMGQRIGLNVAAIHLGGPTAKLPRYLLQWVKTRIAGGSL